MQFQVEVLTPNFGNTAAISLLNEQKAQLISAGQSGDIAAATQGLANVLALVSQAGKSLLSENLAVLKSIVNVQENSLDSTDSVAQKASLWQLLTENSTGVDDTIASVSLASLNSLSSSILSDATGDVEYTDVYGNLAANTFANLVIVSKTNLSLSKKTTESVENLGLVLGKNVAPGEIPLTAKSSGRHFDVSAQRFAGVEEEWAIYHAESSQDSALFPGNAAGVQNTTSTVIFSSSSNYRDPADNVTFLTELATLSVFDSNNSKIAIRNTPGILISITRLGERNLSKLLKDVRVFS